MLETMEPQEMARMMALFYVAGIIVAALVFRIVRSLRKRRDKSKEPLL
ncbi:MAG: hypothetical protein JSW54_01405 [Fidelibacterota bacterium]|nr:MAG: hypothetical protein JSW54_01405 [Candidatus Neomarinimicrobiota bacterium]